MNGQYVITQPPNLNWDKKPGRISNLLWDLLMFVLSKTKPARER